MRIGNRSMQSLPTRFLRYPKRRVGASIRHHVHAYVQGRSISDDCAGRRPQTPHQLQEPDWPRHSAYYRYTQQGMYTMHGRPSRHGWIMPVG